MSAAVDSLTDAGISSSAALLSFNPSVLKLLLHLQNTVLAGPGGAGGRELVGAKSALLSDDSHQAALLARADAGRRGAERAGEALPAGAGRGRQEAQELLERHRHRAGGGSGGCRVCRCETGACGKG